MSTEPGDQQELPNSSALTKDLFDLKTKVERGELLRTLSGQRSSLTPWENTRRDLYSEPTKIAKSETLATPEQQGIIIQKAGEIRDWLFTHGEERTERLDEDLGGGEEKFMRVDLGIFNSYADIESPESTFLSLAADDNENKANVDLTISRDLKTYELDIIFLEVHPSDTRNKYKSGSLPFDQMTDVEHRIINGYMDKFIAESAISNSFS